MISTNRVVRKAVNAQHERKVMATANAIVANALRAKNAQASEGEPVATNAPFFKKGQRVRAKSGRWKGEIGSIIDIANKPGMRGLARIWNPEYTVEFLHGTWKTNGDDLQSF